ncbi:hypothetical protein Bca101_017376 [Brassica carinata]
MAKKHFFQPLLPGFHSHLTIPVAFFSKHMKGRNDQKTTAKLRSDASDKTWEVKKTEDDGRRLTDGWKEFAVAHDLRVGDVLIFRQEKDMTFHVTLFGPSCSEIQYESSCLDDKKYIQGKTNSKKKNPKREAECSSDPSCFLASVMPSTLRYDLLNLPMSFVRANGLERRCGEDIVLMNEKGRSWTLSLKQRECGRRSYITRGWRSFCSANGLKAGDFFSFKLIKRGGTLVLLLRKSPSHKEEEEDEGSEADDEIESLSTESESDEEKECNHDEKRRISIWKASSSPSLNRFVTLTLKPYNVMKCVLGVKWSTKLRSEGKERIRMAGGWKDFFKANCVKTGESIKLKLFWEDDTSCALKFCSKVKP